MLCADCPFSEIREITTKTTPIYYLECTIDECPHDPTDECFFPETVKEKGV